MEMELGATMKTAFLDHAAQILGILPEVYMLCPSSDYQSSVSHSVESLTKNSWDRTCAQMQAAISSFEGKNPHVKRSLPTII